MAGRVLLLHLAQQGRLALIVRGLRQAELASREMMSVVFVRLVDELCQLYPPRQVEQYQVRSRELFLRVVGQILANFVGVVRHK